MLYYRLKNDIVNLSQVKRISKRDELTPFSKDEDKDSWESHSNGKFIISVDDVDYQYDSLADRDLVFGDNSTSYGQRQRLLFQTDRLWQMHFRKSGKNCSFCDLFLNFYQSSFILLL